MFAGAGEGGRRISNIGWFMVITAAVIALGFYGLLVWAMLRGGRRARWSENGVVMAGGVALPAVVIVALTVSTLGALDSRVGGGAVQIDVVGHQYWWEVHYPAAGVVTANEFRIPVGTKVEVTLTSDDVIHSFWLPALDGKVDMVPGHTNHLTLMARTAGLYRGQCAEYCGLQHARMAFYVRASPPAEYERWLAEQAHDAALTEHRVSAGRAVRVHAAPVCELPRHPRHLGRRRRRPGPHPPRLEEHARRWGHPE